jgi:hypothetical protein
MKITEYIETLSFNKIKTILEDISFFLSEKGWIKNENFSLIEPIVAPLVKLSMSYNDKYFIFISFNLRVICLEQYLYSNSSIKIFDCSCTNSSQLETLLDCFGVSN